MNNINTIYGVKRVNKTRAKNLHQKGYTVSLLPCKVRYSNMWIEPFMLDKTADFESQVNSYSYYNCQYNELGYYPSYYVNDSI